MVLIMYKFNVNNFIRDDILEIVHDFIMFELMDAKTLYTANVLTKELLEEHEIVKWCNKKFIGFKYNFDIAFDYSTNLLLINIEFYFNNNKDVMLFKLVWG